MVTGDEKVRVVCANCNKVVEIDVPVQMPKEMAEMARCPNCGTVANLKLF